MLIEINPESEFAKELYAKALRRSKSILDEREENRKEFLNKNRRLAGTIIRRGFLNLFSIKSEKDETDEEVEKRIKDSLEWYEWVPEELAPVRYRNQLDTCLKYATLFEKGVRFFLNKDEFNYIN